MTLYFNSKDEYDKYYESLINNTEFKEHKSKAGTPFYTYKQFIIDVNFDVGEEDETCVSDKEQSSLDPQGDTFEPFYKPPFYQIITKPEDNTIKQIQYDRPLILLDYKNDLIKYKNEIIKYIDNKEYENDE